MSVAAPPPWPRILTPGEVAAIRSVIDLPRLRILFDVMLYSGMRYADLRQVLAEPDRFDEERGTITILTGGKKQRTVVLGDRGREAVTEFVGRGAQMPVWTSGWRKHLVRWSKEAGLPPHPDPPPGASLGNPSGIGVTSMRMTWESWLYALHPEWLRPIMASQGRDETGDITRYGALSWSTDDLEAMRLETAGWEPLDLRDRSHAAAVRLPQPSPPDPTADVLRLHADGATVREIAAGTGLSSGEVRACLHRAGKATAPGFYARGRAREIFDERGAERGAMGRAGTGDPRPGAAARPRTSPSRRRDERSEWRRGAESRRRPVTGHAGLQAGVGGGYPARSRDRGNGGCGASMPATRAGGGPSAERARLRRYDHRVAVDGNGCSTVGRRMTAIGSRKTAGRGSPPGVPISEVARRAPPSFERRPLHTVGGPPDLGGSSVATVPARSHVAARRHERSSQ